MAREWGSADWERLLAERGDQLMGTAIALGGSRDAGEDLLQAALERVLRKPRQVDRDMEGCLRRVLYNLAADGWRRRGRWRKKLRCCDLRPFWPLQTTPRRSTCGTRWCGWCCNCRRGSAR